MNRIYFLSAVILCLAVACSTPDRVSQDRYPSSSSASLPLAAPLLLKLYKGPTEINLEGFSRKPAKVFLPLQYDQKEKWPLVVLLHGFTGTAEHEDAYLALSIRASIRGFILITPEGTKVPAGTVSPEGKDFSGMPFWNATDYCCDFGKTGVDDVAYLKHLIEHTKQTYKVDADKVFLFGHSNGGFMANRLACEIGGDIAAIASLGGGSFSDLSHCRKATPISYLQIHARDDETVKYEEAEKYAGGLETVHQWIKRNGCDKPHRSKPKRDFVFLLPGDDTAMQNWRNCESGKRVALWTIQSNEQNVGGHNPHVPFFNLTFTDAVLDFLFSQSR